MMQRLFTVTSGYLKFTFACMLAGTAAFFLMGLAITAPKIFLIVMAIAVAGFLIVRMEVKSHRHARELSKRDDPKRDDPKRDVKTLIQYLAFAEATSMVLSSVDDEITIDAPSLWVSEWHHIDDPSSTPESASKDEALFEKVQMASAIKDLQQRQGELAKHGLYILSISKMSAEQLVKSIRHAAPGTWSRILASDLGTVKTEGRLSIVFLHDTRTPLRVDVVQKLLLQASFRMVRVGINLQSNSTLS